MSAMAVVTNNCCDCWSVGGRIPWDVTFALLRGKKPFHSRVPGKYYMLNTEDFHIEVH
jgi:hypothetical protein